MNRQSFDVTLLLIEVGPNENLIVAHERTITIPPLIPHLTLVTILMLVNKNRRPPVEFIALVARTDPALAEDLMRLLNEIELARRGRQKCDEAAQ
jgi:hypothetical protein